MKHKPWNIVFHELIGLQVKILKSLNPGTEGLEGIVVGESSRTLLIVSKGKTLRILKQGTLFLFLLPSGEKVLVEGDNILGDPAERTKRLKRGRRR